jgi:D-alanyl-D-alanine carboxypeptidase (penicillin-binding protein 5/6)
VKGFNRGRRFLFPLLICYLAGTGAQALARPAQPRSVSSPSVRVRAALLIERVSGQILYAKAEDERLPPASLTKVMTALVALESDSLEAMVTIDRESVVRRRPKIGVRPGDRFALRDLVSAMLITSANDACLAVARHVGGSEAEFVAMMNEKAATLGLVDTHFSNACGFDGPEHYSSAIDLAVLTEEALKNDVFARIVRTIRTQISTSDHRRHFRLSNTNRLLVNPDVTGLKTGFTSEAGHCLIATASRNGKSLLLVGLHFRHRWGGAMALLRYGFARAQGMVEG